MYLYADGLIQWTTSDDSFGTDGLGGNPAIVGFTSLDGVNFFTIPQSNTPAVINVTLFSNVNTPGVWMFRVDGEGK